MAYSYNEVLNEIKGKTFKVFKLHGCNTTPIEITFDATGKSLDGTLQLFPDNTQDEMSGQLIPDGTISDNRDVYNQIGGTVVDFDEKGLLIATGQVSDGESNLVGDIFWLVDSFSEQSVDMSMMLPFQKGDTIFNNDGTITNYWNEGDSFTIGSDGPIVIPDNYGGEYHMQIVYEIGNHFSDVSYFSMKKVDVNETIDILFPNGWSLSGVREGEILNVNDIKCSEGNLISIWKYKEGSWKLYVPAGIDYGFENFTELSNREGFWVLCQ